MDLCGALLRCDGRRTAASISCQSRNRLVEASCSMPSLAPLLTDQVSQPTPLFSGETRLLDVLGSLPDPADRCAYIQSGQRQETAEVLGVGAERAHGVEVEVAQDVKRLSRRRENEDDQTSWYLSGETRKNVRSLRCSARMVFLLPRHGWPRWPPGTRGPP